MVNDFQDNSINWRKDPRSVKKYQFIHNFIPNPQNQTRALLLQNKSILTYCFVLFLLGFLFRIIPVLLPGILGYASNINVSELLSSTNKKRSSNGLSSLTMNSKLSSAAQKKAEDMFKNGYWAHVSPSGQQPWDFIVSQGYEYSYAGENLAKNFSNSKDVVEAWYNSSSHKENLLNKNYTEIGFAIVNGVLNGYETTLVVQMFGKPRVPAALAAAPTPSVTPAPVTVSTPTPISTSTATQEPESTPITNTPPETQQEQQPLVENFIQPVRGASEETPIIYQQISVKPKIDITQASRYLSIIFAIFIMVLLSLDYWYTKKLGIVKINGHTIAHITFLLVVIVSIWFVLSPGAVL